MTKQDGCAVQAEVAGPRMYDYSCVKTRAIRRVFVVLNDVTEATQKNRAESDRASVRRVGNLIAE